VEVPAQLEAIIFKALAKDRERRFHSAAEFAKALDDALLAIPEIEYPQTIVAAVLVVACVAMAQRARISPTAEPTRPVHASGAPAR